MAGWVSISRDLFAHPFFAREPMSEREAWVWMIVRAAWEDTRHRAGTEMVEVPRGSFFCTLRELQVTWGWASDKRVRGFLSRLEKDEMIGRRGRHEMAAKKTQITICNYEEFQHDGRRQDAAGTQPGRTKETTKQETRVKEEEANASSLKKSAGTRLPRDWFLPKEWGEWAVSQGWAEGDTRDQADRFRDHWHGKTGANATKLDWLATWRNWLRVAKDRKPRLTAITNPRGTRNGNAAFDRAINTLADDLSSGNVQLDYSSRDPLASIRR